MFDENLTLTGKRLLSGNVSCEVVACTYPQEDIETFTETSEDSQLKKRKVLVQKSSSIVPQIGDKLMIDNASWLVSEVDDVQQWYDIEVSK